MKRRIAAYRIKILMRNGVSPVDQFLQQLISSNVSRVVTVHVWPKLDSEPIEIRTDSTGVWIAFVQASVPDEFHAQECLKLCRGSGDDMVDALGMKIAAEPLEMR